MKAECSFSEPLSVFPSSAFSYIILIANRKEKSGTNMSGTRNKQFLKNLTPCIQGVILLKVLALYIFDC